MNDLFWFSDEKMTRFEFFFPKFHRGGRKNLDQG